MPSASSGISSPTSSPSSPKSSSQDESDLEERANLLSHADGTDSTSGEDHPESSSNAEVSNQELIRIVAVLLIGVFLSSCDINIVVATHASIASKFNDLENANWILVSFTLALICTQSLLGKLSGLYGRKYVLLRAYALFILGCLIIGIAPSFWIVVLGRVLSGIGCGGMMALVSIIITDLVPLRDVASWRSFVNIFATAGRMSGGPLGGLLADTVGWRWSFLIQVPIMLLASALAWLLIPENIPRTSSTEPVQTQRKDLSRLDTLGSVLLIATLLLLLSPFELGGRQIPWSHVAAGIATSVLFAKAQARATEPVLPLRLFQEPDVLLSFLIMALQMAAQSSMMASVPLYFQVTGGGAVSAAEAGAHLVPALLGNTISQLLSGAFIKRYGNHKALITLGTTFTSIGYVLMLLRWDGHTTFWESLYVMPGGFGTGLAASTLFIALTASLPSSLRAIGSSSMSLATSVGAVIGFSSSADVLQATVRHGLQVVIGPDVKNRDEFIRQCLEDLEFVQRLEGSIKENVIGLYIRGFKGIYVMSLAFSIVGSVAGFFIKKRALPNA